ncbi:acyl CoA:acetate/3-ketoacid CoA transferase [Salinicoccus albus]|uniref:fatty acid degradation protein FadX n=1 Tax=Salinicoccus albus TaxID=418756 RepID=UPI0003772DD0|nr:acyl CoA:acetate/3-ketoacid CoA transferase [Salinicoccus albus]
MEIISYCHLKNIVNNNDVISMAALSVANLPVEILKHLAEQYDEGGVPGHLTFIVANDISDYADGYDLDSFVRRGMVKRLITSLITSSPQTIHAIENNDIETYFFPQGILATQYRSQSDSFPGMITKIGVNTNVDPRWSGGKVNDRTTEDLVSLIEIDGEEYLHYNFPGIDTALLRGTYADIDGNIFMIHEAHLGEGYSVAAATRKNGGKVIVQVKEVVETGSFHPHDVFLPGELVDYVVVNDNTKYHKQVMQTYYDPALSGHYRLTEMKGPPVELSSRKLILRRSAQFLLEEDVVSIGFGINNELSDVLIEEQVDHLVQLNVDTGVFGGMIGSRDYLGMNYNLDARMPHDMTWDFIYNGGVDIAYLSFAEIDHSGNVNVSRFGTRRSGSGGFIDITQTVKTLIFSGVMVAGSKTVCKNNTLIIEQEGHSNKFVDDVQNIDFNAGYSRELNQQVFYVTERAVFQLTDKGVALIEIAPGLDIQKDILAHMDFTPIMAEDITVMDERIYQSKWGNLSQSIKNGRRINKGEDKYEL